MRRQRRFAALLGALLLVFLFGGCGGWEGKEQEPSGQQEISRLKVTFFDVGKGDAILLETEGETMLIDTGYDDTADVILEISGILNINGIAIILKCCDLTFTCDCQIAIFVNRND